MDNELEESATAKNFLLVQMEGNRRIRRQIKHCNLDAIISVGYRVNSRRGVRFRQWATGTLREHLVRGYTINHQRFEDNARELETALTLVRKAASGDALTTIKNHPFSDGNKRIGSFLFVEFLHRNGRLVRAGEPVINDVGLAALALLVAESAPKDKEVMIRLVMNMLAEHT